MSQHSPSHRISLSLFLFCSLLALAISLLRCSTAYAFDELTKAQQLIYNKPHLANTRAGQHLVYRYSSQLGQNPRREDVITLKIINAYDNDKRDVVVEFLTGENTVLLPDFNAFRGNPVIVAMLEHIAQSMGNETGGGVLYFRNRIRDALASENLLIDDLDFHWQEQPVKSTRLTFAPFIKDPYLAQKPEYRYTEISITLSEEVPGSVVGITVESAKDDTVYFKRIFTLQSGT